MLLPLPAMTDPRRTTAKPPFVLASIATVILVLWLAWDWNWFKPLVERKASAALARPVHLAHFDIRLARQPLIFLEGLRIENPKGFPPNTDLASVRAITLKLDGAALWHRVLRILEITVDKAEGDLYTYAGQRNWKLAYEPGKEPGFFQLELGRLVINDSRLRFRDPQYRADFTAQVHTLPANAKDGEDAVHAELQGRYHDEPIRGYFTGGTLLGLRDPARPYPVDAALINGGTELKLRGAVERPLTLGGARLRLDFSGPNMALLYPLTGLPLPDTPPYKLSSAVDYAPGRMLLQQLKGRLGSSDIAGDVAVNFWGERRQLSGSLSSQKVVLGDLAGFIGGKPSGQGPQNAAAPDDRVLPDQRIDIPKLNAGDVDLRYAAARIEGEKMPLDDLKAHVVLKNGRYSFEPLRFGVGEGEIAVNAVLDARQAEPRIDSEVRFRQVDASKLLDAVAIRGAGTVAGRISLKSRGTSVAKMMAVGNGEAQLFMQGGNLSALLVDLAGIDLGNSVISLLGLPRRSEIRCMVADFGLQDGLLGSRLLLVDTSSANLIANGQLNFKDESLDYRLHTEPKRFNVGSLAAPILVRGTLKNPSVRPDLVRLGARAGIAVAVGSILSPLAALIPTVQLGLGKDNNCNALLADVQAQAKAPVKAPPKKKARR